jgi:hypothetical protein
MLQSDMTLIIALIANFAMIHLYHQAMADKIIDITISTGILMIFLWEMKGLLWIATKKRPALDQSSSGPFVI